MFSFALFVLVPIYLSRTGKSASVSCIAAQGAEKSDNTWMVTIGGSLDDGSRKLLETSDGGYLLLGGTNIPSNPPNSDIWISKIGPDGYVDWEKTYGGASSDQAEDVIEVDDGYIFVGRTSSSGIGNNDGLVVKLDKGGSIVWQHTYGHLNEDMFSAIVETNDKGYLIVGSTQIIRAEIQWDALVVKLNSDGSFAWKKSYGGSGSDHFGSIMMTNDGEYLLFGNTNSFGTGSLNLWSVKIKPGGDISWQKTYSSLYALYGTLITEMKDGSYILGGSTYGEISSVLSHDAFMLKLDNSGEIIWQKAYGWPFADGISAVQETVDGDLIAAGYLGLQASSDIDAWVLKMNSEGNPIWQYLYGSTVSDNFTSMMTNWDNTLTFFGTTNSFGEGRYDMLLVTTDENGMLGNCEYFSEGIALPSSIEPIVVSSSAASIWTPVGFYMTSDLEQSDSDEWLIFAQ